MKRSANEAKLLDKKIPIRLKPDSKKSPTAHNIIRQKSFFFLHKKAMLFANSQNLSPPKKVTTKVLNQKKVFAHPHHYHI